MKWKLVKDECPPLNKSILIGIINYYGDRNEFEWFATRIFKPFDRNPESHPDLYKYYNIEEQVKTLSPYYLWCEVEFPDHEDLKKRDKS
jgi:hypothetical protein